MQLKGVEGVEVDKGEISSKVTVLRVKYHQIHYHQTSEIH